MNRTLEQLVVETKNSINNTLETPEMLTALAEWGYTKEKIQQGKMLQVNATDLFYAQKRESGDQEEATQEMRQARYQANKVYMRYLKIARVALEDDIKALKDMEMLGIRKASFAAWIIQATSFYTNALKNREILAKLAEYNITKEKLNAGLAMINEANLLKEKRDQEMSEAQEATVERDKVMTELDKWYSQFIAVSKVALEDKPQALEMLGITVAAEV